MIFTRAARLALGLSVLHALMACSKGAPEQVAPPKQEASPSPAAEQPSNATIRIAAASDLSAAFPELGKTFEQQTGQHVELSFGASGLLTKQLEQGAPFDLFASANTQFVDQLIDKGVCDAASKAPYARGHLVMWSKRDISVPSTLEELREPRFKRIAIANPETAPYGKAAKQALEQADLWAPLEKRVVFAENIRQTLQFAESGNAEVALVALSLALVAKDGHYVEVPASLHAPIDQALVVCKNGKNSAGGAAFAKFVNGDQGRVMMRRFGLLLPGEQLIDAP